MALGKKYPFIKNKRYFIHKMVFCRNTVITTEKLNQEIGCLGVKVEEGEGKLPKLVLKSNGGSEAEIYLFGGCISSWKIQNGKALLFVRPDVVFNGQKPIRLSLVLNIISLKF
jgi:hypothetical protein